jgi:hypothetical protein
MILFDTGAPQAEHVKLMPVHTFAVRHWPRHPGDERLVHVAMEDQVNFSLNDPPDDRLSIKENARSVFWVGHFPESYRYHVMVQDKDSESAWERQSSGVIGVAPGSWLPAKAIGGVFQLLATDQAVALKDIGFLSQQTRI